MKIVGAIDLSSNHTIEITFIATSFILNAKYQIEEGYTLFKIIPEYFEDQENFGFFVAAKDLSFKTEKVYHFPFDSDTNT